MQEKLSLIDYNIIFNSDTVDDMPIEVLDLGLLHVPTGKIVACDPFVCPDSDPFTKTVPPGDYPVKIYVAKTPNAGDRHAIAKLEITPDRADKWVMALTEAQDIGKLIDYDSYFGFPVDAGLGSFFDYSAGLDYNKYDEKYANIYNDLVDAEFKKSAEDPNNPDDIGSWANFKIPGTESNIVMFTSGLGDGSYPAYWGMKNDGEIVSLVIDFFLLEGRVS